MASLKHVAFHQSIWEAEGGVKVILNTKILSKISPERNPEVLKHTARLIASAAALCGSLGLSGELKAEFIILYWVTLGVVYQ